MKLQINHEAVALTRIGDFARMPAGERPARLELQYDLPTRKTVETLEGVEYEFIWQGDDILGVTPNSEFIPAYPDAPAEKYGRSYP